MNKTAYCLPLLLALAASAQAQEQPINDACPQLPADADLLWQHKATPTSDFCRALRADGSEAFGLYIASQSPFKPSRSDRAEQASIDGRDVTWYRSELATRPGMQARETLLELPDGRVAHIWVQASSEAQLGEAIGQTKALHFQSARLSSK
ncbi:hypothetical protein ACFQZQ_05345 [Lysobacter koreensis]|uniref:Uncharacterized protein n=1 Tax=Lysobacter koreensis TaxID=266122 RepID=A0ABW2YJU0_9GAMM